MQTKKELERLQRIAEEQKQRKAKIEGRIESLMDDLQDEGFDSVEDAKKAIAALDKDIKAKTKLFQEKLHGFKLKYAEQLAEVN